MRRALSRAAALLRAAAPAALAALLACRSEPVAGDGASAGGPTPERLSGAASGASSVAVPAPPFDAARFDAAAKAFVDAARAYAETCDLQADAPGNWFDYITYDVCSTDAKDAAPVLVAGDALRDAAGAMAGAPLAANAVAEQGRIFRNWADEVQRIRVTRGTLLLYQGLALAYNAYKPDAVVPTEPKRALDQYFVDYPSRGVAYIWEQKSCHDEETLRYMYSGCIAGQPGVRMTRYEVHRRRGTPLAWRSSPQGPFLID